MGRFVIEEDTAASPQGRFVVEDDSRNTEIARGAKLTNSEADQYMQNRAKFANEGGVSTFGKKGATDTRKISYTDTGYRPNKKATNAKELAKNFVQDVVELPLMPVRMADQIANSPDTLQTLADIGKGLVTTPLSFVPYAGEALGGTSAENAWLTNPGLGALTIAGVTGAVKGIKGGSSLADIAPDTAAPLADRVATKLYDMTLKQGTTLKPEIRAANVKLGLEGEYLPNAKGVDKLAGDIAATEGKLGEGIAAGEAAKVTGTLDRAIANIEALRPAANRSANPVKANAMIDAEIARLRGNPIQGTDGAIPIGEMQKMKVEQGRTIKYQQKMNQPVDPFKTSIDKARVRGLREELESQLSDAFPELADTNKKLGGMYQLQDVLERAANRIENNQGIGIGLPIKGGAGAAIGGMIGGPTGAAIGSGVGALIGIIEHPSVAPRLAIALYRHSKGRYSKAQATAMVNDRLDKMKTDLVQREQTVLDSESLPKVSNGNLGDTIDPTAYAPEYGWEGKPPAAPEVANPEVLPPRQSSHMPVISDQGGRIVPQVEAMTKRIPQGFNPEVAGTEESQLGDRLAPKPKPLRDAGNGPKSGIPPQEPPPTAPTAPPAKSGRAIVGEGFHPETANYLKQKLSSLDSEFPSGKDPIKIVTDDKTGNLEHDGFTGELRMRPYMAQFSPADLEKVYTGWAKSTGTLPGLDATIDHEFAHVVDGRIIRSLADDAAKEEYWNAKKALMEKLGYPSEYAKKNQSEWLAEQFAYERANGVKGGIIDFLKERLPKVDTGTHPAAVRTWKEYVAANMSRAMKEAGSHGEAMKKLAKEWGQVTKQKQP